MEILNSRLVDAAPFYFKIMSAKYWNYRVIRKNGEFGIHGVYYDENDNIIGYDIEPNVYVGSDLNDLKNTLTLMMEATDKEILDFELLSVKLV